MDASQLMKGVLDVAVLAVLADGEAYGYDIVRRLRGAGLEEVGDASVYGTLRRLFDAGHLTSFLVPSDAGPNRKYYGLTASGRETLEASVKIWRRFSESVDFLIDQGGDQ